MIIVFNYKDKQLYTKKALIGSLLRQMMQGSSDGTHLECIQHLFDHHSRYRTRPSLDELYTTLRNSLQQYRKWSIIVDAVDECPEFARPLLKWIINLFSGDCGSVFVTSRHPPVEWFRLSDRIVVDSDDKDLRAYIEKRIIDDPLLGALEFRDEIIARVTARANKM